MVYTKPVTPVSGVAATTEATLTIQMDGDADSHQIRPLAVDEMAIVQSRTINIAPGTEVLGAFAMDEATRLAMPAEPYPNQVYTFVQVPQGDGSVATTSTLRWNIPLNERSPVVADPIVVRTVVDYKTNRWTN